jgi:hypothetical protein
MALLLSREEVSAAKKRLRKSEMELEILWNE